ncbi:MAG: ABC-F family ATP-binding cassette domain-containing protein [Bacilli bacterium]
MSIVEISKLNHGFGERTLWQNIDVNLLPREHVALIGRNGVGKSTLLKILADHIPHDNGRIAWTPGVKIGYLTQLADLSRFATVRSALQEAFADLFAKERALQATAEDLAHAEGDELERLLSRYARIQAELDHAGIYELGARIDTVASGLGLLELGLDRPVTDLSGGQRTKVLLAKLLLEQPDVLLLDEPTNFLDVLHIAWLTDFLKNYPFAFIVVSHDADFVAEVATVIWQLENAALTRFNGPYKAFLAYAEQRTLQHAGAYSRQQDEIRRMEDFVQKNIARASTTKRAQSRRKQLEKIDRIPPLGTAAPPHFTFPLAGAPARFVIRAAALEIGYSHALLPPLELEVERGSKLALIGCNGIGKSTLLRTLIGELEPLRGRVELGDHARIGYFAQEVYQSDQGHALEVVWSAFPHLTQQEARAALARSGLKREHILQSVHRLSGGEQAKVRLCLLTLQKHNVLVLDEPTNHLDHAARDALQQALKDFRGTLLMVSHEPEFYRPFVTSVVDVEELLGRGKASKIVARQKR